jgi:O-acetyl-ADP-ribose deacetylase (regulator of RNase III)
LPAFGTGVGGFPIDECARIMIEAIRAEAASMARVRLVRLVLFGRAAYDAFREAATDLLDATSR